MNDLKCMPDSARRKWKSAPRAINHAAEIRRMVGDITSLDHRLTEIESGKAQTIDRIVRALRAIQETLRIVNNQVERLDRSVFGGDDGC